MSGMNSIATFLAPARLPILVKIASALVLVDLLLIAAHISSGYLVHLAEIEAVPRALDVRHPWSASSIFTYVKWAAVSYLLYRMYIQSRETMYASLCAIFLVVFTDDALEIHERLGHHIQGALGYVQAFGLRGQDYGELTVWAGIGLACLTIFLFGYGRSSRSAKGVGLIFLMGIGAAAFFGIVVDMLDIMIGTLWSGLAADITQFAFETLEDGGEMIVASLLCSYAYALLAAYDEYASASHDRH